MTNYSTGHDAEKAAANYLKHQGFTIKELNWKTRFCEIDIVAERAGTIYFVEVKHRTSRHFGNGLEYITPKKLQQMHFAAEIWIHNHNYIGDCGLAALASSPDGFEFVEI